MPVSEDKDRHLWVEEDRHSPLVRHRSAGLRAGLFLLEGRVHFAAPTSPAERRLREAGALHFADVTFDGGDAAAPEAGPLLRGTPAQAGQAEPGSPRARTLHRPLTGGGRRW